MPNAIDRLRAGIATPFPQDNRRQYEGIQDALAAVEALYQAAKDSVDVPDENYTLAAIRAREDALAAAVRRVEGE